MNRKDFLKALIAIPAATFGVVGLKSKQTKKVDLRWKGIEGGSIKYYQPDSDGDVFTKWPFDPNKKLTYQDVADYWKAKRAKRKDWNS